MKSKVLKLKNLFQHKETLGGSTEPETYAVLSGDNTTLTFYYGVPVGSHFKGEEVTAKWQGDEVLKSTKTPGWVNTVRSTVTTVVFDPSFASMSPTSGYCWFYNFSRLAEIQNLRYLDTSKMTDMTGMFYHCSLLKEFLLQASWNLNISAEMILPKVDPPGCIKIRCADFLVFIK